MTGFSPGQPLVSRVKEMESDSLLSYSKLSAEAKKYSADRTTITDATNTLGPIVFGMVDSTRVQFLIRYHRMLMVFAAIVSSVVDFKLLELNTEVSDLVSEFNSSVRSFNAWFQASLCNFTEASAGWAAGVDLSSVCGSTSKLMNVWLEKAWTPAGPLIVPPA